MLKKLFSGKGETSYDTGNVSYTYRTTDKVNTTPVSKETVTTTDAHVDYNYTSIETRTVTVDGEETVIVPPVTPPETPVEDETPDEVVTPETPELPPVQDATPDEVVLPAEPELPAVEAAARSAQDRRELDCRPGHGIQRHAADHRRRIRQPQVQGKALMLSTPNAIHVKS